MKWKLALCVAALALGAGCKTSQENPYASFGEYGFSYDLSQQPVQGLTVAESQRIDKAPSATPGQLLAPPAVMPVATRPPAPNMDPVAPTTVPMTPASADSAAPATPAPAQ